MNKKEKAQNFKDKYQGKVEKAVQKRKEDNAEAKGEEKPKSKKEAFLEMINKKKKKWPFLISVRLV